ncbi:MAG: 8-amino-7-oxononanoate synthase [Bacteroidetes bacterium]|nr:8-amino-7-oxononanoate synthase [Bacteroidota bacterium]
MDPIRKYILGKIADRKNEDNFRSLRVVKGNADFTSNDYLGLSRDSKFHHLIDEEVQRHHLYGGSTGSRLLSGNNDYVERLEAQIAAFHRSEASLIFTSGFDANYGLMSTLPYKGDTIIYDELVHASIHDGMKASKANKVAFKHNDLADFEEKLKNATGLKYVVTESLFSMDGDTAPLKEMSVLCAKYDAGLIVDEAHATGVIGEKGEGLVNHLGIENNVLARVHTFSKALGGHGAAIVCSHDLKEFLINYCRPFIYSTAMSLHSLGAIKVAYDYFPTLKDRRVKLRQLELLLKENFQSTDEIKLLPSDSPIQSVMIQGNSKVKHIASLLQREGLDARAILPPTVAKGQERIRICLHSHNTEAQVKALAAVIQGISQNMAQASA